MREAREDPDCEEMTAATAEEEERAHQAYYAAVGYLVLASRHREALGPVPRWGWIDKWAERHAWSVVGDATEAEFLEQRRIVGYPEKHVGIWHYYRMVALD